MKYATVGKKFGATLATVGAAAVSTANAAGQDYSSLTTAVDWSSVGAALLAVGVAIIGIQVVFKGIKLVTRSVKGA